MKIISWNVNGIRAVHRKGLFVPFIEAHNPDIICLQETKSKQDQNEVDLSAYKEYWNSADKAGYSGTAIFSKETPLSVTYGLSPDLVERYSLHDDQYGDPNTEGRMITAEFPDFYIVNVYTPNSKQDLSRLKLRHDKWDPAFLGHCTLLEKTKPVIFCGDLNVAHTPDDLANPKPNEGEHGYTTEERSGIDKVVTAGFVDTFRHFTTGNGHYTWWTPWRDARARNVGWRIDYIFVSNKLLPRIKHSKILSEVMGSDHCPVEIEIM